MDIGPVPCQLSPNGGDNIDPDGGESNTSLPQRTTSQLKWRPALWRQPGSGSNLIDWKAVEWLPWYSVTVSPTQSVTLIFAIVKPGHSEPVRYLQLILRYLSNIYGEY